MTKLAIVRSINMIKLMNLTRTIHALKTTTKITKIIILYCTKYKTGKQMSQITIALKKTLRLQVTKITIASSLTNCFCNNCSMSGGSGFSPKVALLLLCFTLTVFALIKTLCWVVFEGKNHHVDI